MRPQGAYRVREFAQLAGVTVRTLHFYDQKGLLRPARRTESGQRLYRPRDLLRLQQILALKHVGFSLEEIGRLLDSPRYDVRRSLQIQQRAVARRIRELQQASAAIDEVLATLESGEADDLDWRQITDIMRGAMAMDNQEWIKQYYTPEQWAQLQERAKTIPPETMQGGQQAWADLIAEFKAKQHLPPDHPEVQALAARHEALVAEFTQGDPGILASLQQMYADRGQMPAEYRPYGDDVANFMERAVKVYRERPGRQQRA
jgi:DNA-binding transcriptional MerR regulator